MSQSENLEQLRNKKTELSEELATLEKREKSLQESVMFLEEKLAIAAMAKNNSAKKEAVAKLETKVAELEEKLKALSIEPKKDAAKEEAPKESSQSAEEAPAEGASEEGVVTVTEFEEPMMEEQKEAKQKKRHSFF